MLLDHGHAFARYYPIGQVWTEAQIVRERIGGMMATEAQLVQGAAMSVTAKGGGRFFNRLLKQVRGEPNG